MTASYQAFFGRSDARYINCTHSTKELEKPLKFPYVAAPMTCLMNELVKVQAVLIFKTNCRF